MISNTHHSFIEQTAYTPGEERQIAPSPKRLKQNGGTSQEAVYWSSPATINVIASQILVNLPIHTLLTFQFACKGNIPIANRAWQILRKRHYYQFDWEVCKDKPYQEAWSYIINHTLLSHIDTMSYPPFNKGIDKLQEVEISQLYTYFVKLLPISQQFPFFQVYFNFTLYPKLTHVAILGTNFLAEQKRFIIERSAEEKYGGDLLLRALFEVHAYQQYQVLQRTQHPSSSLPNISFANYYLKLAITKRATCASLIALKMLPENPGNIDLAIEAAKRKDFRALEVIISPFSNQQIEELYQKGYHLGPILARWARIRQEEEGDEKKVEELYSKALQDYGCSIPDFSVHAGEDNPANPNEKNLKLLSEALSTYGDQVPAQLLYHVGTYKQELEKYKEAKIFLARALVAYGDKVPEDLLASIAQNQSFLEAQKADQLISQELMNYGDQAPVQLLAQAGLIKEQLYHFKEAELLYTRAIAASGQNVSAQLLHSAANNKLMIVKYEDADILFQQALTAYEDQNRAGIYHENLPKAILLAAKTKEILSKYQEADNLYTRFFDIGKDITLLTITDAADNKMRLNNKIEEAALIFDKFSSCLPNSELFLAKAAWLIGWSKIPEAKQALEIGIAAFADFKGKIPEKLKQKAADIQKKIADEENIPDKDT